MAKLTNVLKFYLPDIDDTNVVYVKGFQDNFNILEDKLASNLSSEIVDVISTNETDKKMIVDLQAHRWEAHRLSTSDDVNKINNMATYSGYYQINPHKVTTSQLYVLGEDTIGDEGRLNPADDIIYYINNNLTAEDIGFRHSLDFNKVNMAQGNLSLIGDSIEDRLHSDLSFNVLDETDIDIVKDKHLSNAQAKKWEDHILTTDKDTSNPHNVSAENLKSIENESVGGIAIQQAINSQGTDSNINWIKINKTTSNLTDIETRNHDDLQNINEIDYADIDIVKNKHVSNIDMNVLYGHEFSKSSNEVNILDIDGLGTANTTYANAKINPHEIRAKDLFSPDTATHNHGADTIINEINTNGTSEGISTANTSDKIYWNLIDKDNIDGLGNGANINTIPNRSHQELQEILGATLTSTDIVQNKHISDSQGKKWEEHINTIDKANSNPHNVSSQNLMSSTSVNTGGIAIQEAINEQSDVNGINWSKVSKVGSNIIEIATRNHNDLQNISELNSSDVDTVKNKHLSNAEAKVWQDHTEIVDKATSNPHNVSAQNLKSSDSLDVGGLAIQKAINANGNIAGIDWDKIAKDSSNLIDLTIRNHSDLQNVYELDETDVDIVKNKHLSNNQAKQWEDHKNMTDGTNPHNLKANNLYDSTGALNGGIAIIEAINTNGTSASLEWSKLDKTGSNITNLETRNHDDLQNIEVATSSMDGTKNKHISNSDYKNWEDHLGNTNNPHNISIQQIGGNNVVSEINNDNTTTKIIRDKIDYVGSNITEIENRSHADLQNVLEVDLISNDLIKNKHISNDNAKKWESHVNMLDGTNPHGTNASNINITEIENVDSTNIQTALEDLAIKTKRSISGLLTNTGNYIIDGTGVTIQSNSVSIYHTNDFSDILQDEIVPEKHFLFEDFTNNKNNFVYAYYNLATEEVSYEIQSDISLINFSNQIICFIVYREETELEVFRLQPYANGATERILKKDYDYNKYEITGGLELEDSSTKQVDGITPIDAHFSLKSGSIWSVLEKFTLQELDTRTTDLTWYYTELDGSWSKQTTSTPIVWKVDTGNGVVDAINPFVSNWVYRDIFSNNWYIVLGGESYANENDTGLTLGYANAQPPLQLPSVIKEKSVLVGKIITEQNKVVNKAIYRTQGILFTNTSTGFAPLSDHNSLNGLQGGEADQYYHLTTSQVNRLNSIEQGADITDKDNVGLMISNIIYDDTGTSNVSITEIYNNSIEGSSNNVKKIGDTMTGQLGIQVENNCALAVGWDGDIDANEDSNSWIRIGSSEYAFNHVYKGSESGINSAYELWTTNSNISIDNYSINPDGRVWRINQEGQFNLYKNLISNSNIRTSTLNVDTTVDIVGQTKIHKGSTDWKDATIKEDTSLVLGAEGGGYAGSLKLWASSAEPHYSLIRMHHTDLFFDTLGKYYMNWDYTENPGEFYLGDGAQYDTTEETRANYLILRSNDKSYFKNGLQIGTNSNTAGFIADIDGQIHMHNNQISFLSKIHFNSNTNIINQTDSELLLNFNDLTSGNLRFSINGNIDETTGYVSSDVNTFGLKNKDSEWIISNDGTTTKIYHDGINKLNTVSSGIEIVGNSAISGNIYESGILLSDKYLGKTSKASDSDKLDGIDSVNFVYGANNSATTRWDDDLNNRGKSGFYFSGGATINTPNLLQVGYLINCGYSSLEQNGQFQIYADGNGNNFHMRKSVPANANVIFSEWATLYTTLNKPTKTDVGLSNIPNSISSAVNLNDENVLATAKAVKIAYDKAMESSSGGDADNAQTLDNLDSTQFIRSDISNEATGIVNFSNAIKSNASLITDSNGSLVQCGLIKYDTEDGDSISAGISHNGHFQIGHSQTGIKTDLDIESSLIRTGDIETKNLIARENIIFSKSNVKKAEIKYDELTNSMDFIFG